MIPDSLGPGALIACLLAAAGSTGAAAAQQAPDSLGVHADTIATDLDSAARSHARQLDSLRERLEAVRGELLRLRLEHGAGVEQTSGGIRIDVPVRLHAGGERDAGRRGSVLGRIASLARSHYPEASIRVLGTADGGVPCGTRAERLRSRAVIRALTGPHGLDRCRVRRAECGTVPPTDAAAAGSGEPARDAVTVIFASGGRGRLP